MGLSSCFTTQISSRKIWHNVLFKKKKKNLFAVPPKKKAVADVTIFGTQYEYDPIETNNLVDTREYVVLKI